MKRYIKCSMSYKDANNELIQDCEQAIVDTKKIYAELIDIIYGLKKDCEDAADKYFVKLSKDDEKHEQFVYKTYDLDDIKNEVLHHYEANKEQLEP